MSIPIVDAHGVVHLDLTEGVSVESKARQLRAANRYMTAMTMARAGGATFDEAAAQGRRQFEAAWKDVQ
jgi:hypothetical protein